MKPGDRVRVHWGHDDPSLGMVVQPAVGPFRRADGRVAVRLDDWSPSTWAWVDSSMLDPVDLAPPAPTAAAARVSDPSTSHMAARSQTRARLGKGQRRALHAIVVAGGRGLNDFELAEIVGAKQTSIGVRRGELARHTPPLVRRAGVRRPSDTGEPADVWVATDAGIDVWQTMPPEHRGAA